MNKRNQEPKKTVVAVKSFQRPIGLRITL